jgi:predicted Ser/Thr protein kinase
MSTPGPDDPSAPSQPPAELGGLDPKELLQIGLETIITPAGLGPDLDATVRIAAPQASSPGHSQPELPLPEELTNLLPHGNYSVESFLGQGGMGAVYKGVQIRLKRPVAIKIMRRDVGRDHDFEQRFEREAQAMAKLNHPNIVSVIDFGEAGPDYLYIVMELIDGADMMDVIRGGQMTQEMALSLLPQICDALQFAHDHGIVHRDIKPSNIMLTRDGRIKMADFGLAKHFDAESSFRTQTGTGMGTPDYAAPEQFDPSAQIDHRADIYALGVMIYQMITGQLPRGVWKAPSQRAAVEPEWDGIVSRAMQSDPSDRYQQASEVKTDVSSISLADSRARQSVEEVPEAAQPHALASAATKSRAPLLFGIMGLAALIAIGAFFALRDTGDGRAVGPPAAASGSASSNPQKAPATPNAALAGESALPKAAPHTTIAAPLLPESGWKPLFTEKEWQSTQGGREFRDGLLHLSSGQHFSKPQPSPNGAVRVSIHFREDTAVPTIFMRQIKGVGACKLTAKLGSPDIALQVSLPDGSQPASVVLGTHTLPKPIQAGDKVQFELRVVGNDFTALVDGKVVIEGRDAHLKGAGEWGIRADDAWFESVEVQPLPAAATPAPIAASALPESGWKPLLSEEEWRTSNEDHEFVEGLLHVKRLKFLPKAQQPSADGAIRAKVLIRKGAKDVCVFVRKTPATSGYKLMLRPQTGTVYLSRDEGGVSQSLGMQKFAPDSRQANDGVLLELRAQGNHLTALVDSVVLIEAEDNTLKDPGQWGITATDAWFESVEVQPLPAAAMPAPIAAPALPESGWKPLFTDAEWKAKPGFKNGQLNLSHAFATKPQTWRDGAIRARIEYRDDTKSPSLVARQKLKVGGFYYRFGIGSTGNHLYLAHMQLLPQAEAEDQDILSRHFLPAPLKPGDKVLLELRVQGTRLTGLLNGKAVIEAQDTRLQAAGEWGITAMEGWFESVEVQPLSAAATASGTPAWNDWIAEKRRAGAFSNYPQMRDEPTGLRVTADPSAEILIATTFRNGRLRVACVPPESGREVPLILRSQTEAGNTSRYQVSVSKMSGIKIALFQLSSTGEMKWTELKTWPVPKDFDWTREYVLEFTAMNDLLTVSFNGKEVGSVQDSKLPGAGKPGFSALKDTRITKVEYQSLANTTATVSPSPKLSNSASSTKFPPGQWVKLFTKPEDLPADLRKTDNGVTWEDGWIRFGQKQQVLKIPNSDAGNFAVRARFLRGPTREWNKIVLRGSNGKNPHYQIGYSDRLVVQKWIQTGEGNTLGNIDVPAVAPGANYQLEFAAIGNRLIGRFGDSILKMASDDSLKRGEAHIYGAEDVRDIEVINLDGLPEAEALRLLGVDEKGNDLRGKTGAAK